MVLLLVVEYCPVTGGWKQATWVAKNVNYSEVLRLHSSRSSAHFLELPWSYYQGAEYLFHVNPTDWDTYEFICGWLRSGMATINSSGEQAFIENKIKKVTRL